MKIYNVVISVAILFSWSIEASAAVPTRSLQFGVILDASAPPDPNELLEDASFDELEEAASFTLSVSITDSLGEQHPLFVYFFHRQQDDSVSEWTVTLVTNAEHTGGTAGVAQYLASATINLENGVRQGGGPDITFIPIWANGATALTVSVVFSPFEERSGQSGVTCLSQNRGHRCGGESLLDFDGDTQHDFAIWRPEQGMWAILKSSTQNAELIWKQWGLPGDVPMGGDYTGDGTADLVAWRPTNGTWYVCRSERDFDCSSPIIQQFGLPGDRPLAGDYDRDGILDFAVWRRSNGTFYYLSSATQQTVTRQWGLPGDIPLIAGVGE